MATQIGPKIGIEGEKEYRQQMQQIITQAKTLETEMKATASSWDKNTSAMTKNSAIAKNLVQQIDLQKQKLQQFNNMLEQSKAKFGENAQQTQKWQQAVNNATVSLNRMEGELKQLNGAQNFSSLSTSMADLGQRVANVGQSLTNVGMKLTAMVTVPLMAAGTASVELASSLNEARSKCDVVFGAMSEDVKDFADNALEGFGMSKVEATKMAATFGAMATEMGISQKEAAKMAIQLTQLSADLASFHDSETEITSSALEGVFTGQTKALTQFAGAINQANLEEFAAQQGKVYSKMSEGEKVMTRYEMVLERTAAAQGDYQRTNDGLANSIRTFKSAISDAGAALGEALEPIITPMVQALTRLVQKFSELPAPVRSVIAVLLLVVAAIGPVILIIGGLCSAFNAIVVAAPAIVSALMSIATAIMGVELSAGPAIAVIVGVAAACAAAFAAGAAVGYYWDDIADAASNLGDKISNAFQDIMDWNDRLKNNVNGFVSDVASYFASLPRKIIDAIKDAAKRVKDEFDNMIANAKQSGKDFIQGFVDGIKEKIQKVIDVCKKVADTVKDFLGFSRPDKGPLHYYEEWMPHFMQGLAKGIKSNMRLVQGAVDDVAKTMALPLDANASMNMALAGAGADGSSYVGGTTMNVYVDHISELNDLVRIQNQAQQRYRMGVH